MPSTNALSATTIVRINSAAAERTSDLLAVEEPLELRIGGRALAVMMRTPGHDRELAAGLLVTEGIVRSRDDLLDLVPCRPDDGAAEENVLNAVLAPGVTLDDARLARNLVTSSSCGLCSKSSLEAVRRTFPLLARGFAPEREVIAALPARAAAAQAGFAATGAVHAAALFSRDGELRVLREDVGRHNAVDKVIGHAFLAGELPLAESILLVSGRVSFELVQKALAAGIPCLAAISAPTSAAVAFAHANGQTLIGFLRGADRAGAATRMNVYAGTLRDGHGVFPTAVSGDLVEGQP